jgi:osmotically-inducible protein OsmY
MRFLAGLILILALGIAGYWYFGGQSGRDQIRDAGQSVSHGASEARDAVKDKLHDLNFNTDDLREELSKTGQVVREKAHKLGNKVADATADARVTAAIKGKLVADRSLSALSISVSTTDGVVTLSGHVQTHEDIKKAMDLALATDGCDKAISTLQVKP